MGLPKGRLFFRTCRLYPLPQAAPPNPYAHGSIWRFSREHMG
ncbi:hypothetical protein OB446_026025 [Paenibacillus alvei]